MSIKWIFVLLLMAILLSCATTSGFNNDLADKNMCLVEEKIDTRTEPVELYSGYLNYPTSYSYAYTDLLKVNGKEIQYTLTEHKIIHGKNNLYVRCDISNNYDEPMHVSREFLLNVNLKKGHTYKLTPVLIKGLKNNDNSCTIKLYDVTKI